jgi:hypothetical protein
MIRITSDAEECAASSVENLSGYVGNPEIETRDAVLPGFSALHVSQNFHVAVEGLNHGEQQVRC